MDSDLRSVTTLSIATTTAWDSRDARDGCASVVVVVFQEENDSSISITVGK